MTIEEIKNLKDKIYELEGLLELAQLREEKIDELAPLIEARLAGLSANGTDGTNEPNEPNSISSKDSKDFKDSKDIQSPIRTEITEFSDTLDFAEELEKPAEDTEKSEEEPKNIDEEPTATSAKPKSGGTGRKPAFCLNDRFRFRRELFSNSDSEFSEALGRVACMDSYDEAEDYFIGSLGWDPENPEVVDFLEIIRIYFEG